MANPPGTPIWYELLTSDVDAARTFYGEIVGWTANAFPSPDGGMPYTIFNVGESGVAGLAMPSDNLTAARGWIAYFHVEDVDAKAAEVDATGGRIHMPATDLPGVGRVALAADPQGIAFYLMTPAPPPGMEGDSSSFSPTLPGRCSWNELATSDQASALAFYAGLLGWTSTEAMPMGEHGDYSFIDCGGQRLGAMMNRMSPEQPLRWTFYFTVPDVDAAVAKVRDGGGQVMMGPVDVPGGQRIIVCLDPQGNAVGFVSGERA